MTKKGLEKYCDVLKNYCDELNHEIKEIKEYTTFLEKHKINDIVIDGLYNCDIQSLYNRYNIRFAYKGKIYKLKTNFSTGMELKLLKTNYINDSEVILFFQFGKTDYVYKIDKDLNKLQDITSVYDFLKKEKK